MLDLRADSSAGLNECVGSEKERSFERAVGFYGDVAGYDDRAILGVEDDTGFDGASGGNADIVRGEQMGAGVHVALDFGAINVAPVGDQGCAVVFDQVPWESDHFYAGILTWQASQPRW